MATTSPVPGLIEAIPILKPSVLVVGASFVTPSTIPVCACASKVETTLKPLKFKSSSV